MEQPPSLLTAAALCLAYWGFVWARTAAILAGARARGEGSATPAGLSPALLNALFILEMLLIIGASNAVAVAVAARWPGFPRVVAWLACAIGLYLGGAVARVALPGGALRLAGYFFHPAARFFALVLFPVLAVGRYAARLLARVTRAGVDADAVAPAAEVLRVERAAEGHLAAEERDMIDGIISIRDTVAREVMVPRVEMVTADLTDSLEDIKRIVVEKGYSRIPVVDESPDNVVGILHAKDVFKLERTGADIRSVLREPLFVPESKKVNELLREFRAAKSQLAIVVDEYGGTAGLITLEDVLEEIVGEIRDEYDAEVKLLEKVRDGEWLVAGRMDIGELNEQLGLDIPEDDYETLGGFISHLVGKVPANGDRVDYGGARFEVTAADARRVKQVRVTANVAAEEPKE